MLSVWVYISCEAHTNGEGTFGQSPTVPEPYLSLVNDSPHVFADVAEKYVTCLCIIMLNTVSSPGHVSSALN